MKRANVTAGLDNIKKHTHTRSGHDQSAGVIFGDTPHRQVAAATAAKKNDCRGGLNGLEFLLWLHRSR